MRIGSRRGSMVEPPAEDPLFPFTAGRLGSGANMAFTRRTLDAIGGFDEFELVIRKGLDY